MPYSTGLQEWTFLYNIKGCPCWQVALASWMMLAAFDVLYVHLHVDGSTGDTPQMCCSPAYHCPASQL